MRTAILDFVRRLVGQREVINRLDAIEGSQNRLYDALLLQGDGPSQAGRDAGDAGPADAAPAAPETTAGDATGGAALSVFPGTPYSRYAVPLDYPPSRDLRPRWGYSHPRIASLNAWFESFSGEYRDFIQLMRETADPLRDLPIEFSTEQLPEPAWNGVPYAPFDSVALYTMLRKYKPRLYLEIGSGITTCFAHRARRDAKFPMRIESIDPDPRARIDAICDSIIRDGLETCELSIFDRLEPNDVLFFDGSHRSFMNSDVTVFFIDVLPRLKPGVIVHIHDILLPWDYYEAAVNWYWNEQYLLAVYMQGNRERIRPLLPTAFICRDEAFAAELANPIIDLGPLNDGWRGGGAMWFTHTG